MPKPKRVKIQCSLCSRIFDSDYRNRHNAKYHATRLQEQRSIPYTLYGAPANPFKAAANAPSRHASGARAQQSAPAPSAQLQRLPAPQISHVLPIKTVCMEETCDSAARGISQVGPVKRNETCNSAARGISQVGPVKKKETCNSAACGISQVGPVERKEACNSAARGISQVGPVKTKEICNSAARGISQVGPVKTKEICNSAARGISQVEPVKRKETCNSAACGISQVGPVLMDETCVPTLEVHQRKPYTVFRRIRKPKRVKIQCALCSRVFDSDYRNRHNAKYHTTRLQEQRSIPYTLYLAPANPFKFVESATSEPAARASAQQSAPSPSSAELQQLPALQISHVWSVNMECMEETCDSGSFSSQVGPVKTEMETWDSEASVRSQIGPVKMEKTCDLVESVISLVGQVKTEDTCSLTESGIFQVEPVKTDEAICDSKASTIFQDGPVVMDEASNSVASFFFSHADPFNMERVEETSGSMNYADTEQYENKTPRDGIFVSASSASTIIESASRPSTILESAPNEGMIEIASLLDDMLTVLRQGIKLSCMVSNPQFSAAHFCSCVKEFATKIGRKSHTILKACNYLMFGESTALDGPGENGISCDPADRAHAVLTDEQRLFIIKRGPQRPRKRFYPKNPEIDPKKQNTFCSKWFEEYPHLEYSQKADAAFCFACSVCPRADIQGLGHQPWYRTGVRNWHKMKSRGVQTPGKLALHFNSDAHKMAVENLKAFVDKNKCADVQLSGQKNMNLQSCGISYLFVKPC